MKIRMTSLVGLFCLAALVLGAVRIFGTGAEAASGAPQAQNAKRAAEATEAQAAPAARAALDRLRRAGGAQIKAHVARETGHYDFVRASGGAVLSADNPSGAPEGRAAAFLRQHGALVGMSDAERLALGGDSQAGSALKATRVVDDFNGGKHVRLGQSYRGLPVFGAQLVVHMNNRGITAVNGHYVPGIKLDTKAALSPAAAQAVALRQQVGGAKLSVLKTELSVYRQGLLEGYEGQSVLAYNVEVTDGGATRAQVWVDALKGTVLNRISLNHKAKDRIIYTPEYDPLFAVRREGDPYTPGATPGTTGADPINNLYRFAGETYNLWMSGFNRDSYDGAGHTMHSVYLVNDICPNAYWNSTTTNYCPDFDADDVVSHEWGHAYTEHTHGLIYSYQSGGLNESYSDIFGETHDLLNDVDAEGGSNNAQPMPDGQRWQIGEDVPTINAEALGILRDMWDPTRYGDPDKVTSENYGCAPDDVHTTSGVPNHAFAMLVDGKTFNGQTVEGIGFDKALAIYFRAMTVYQTPTTNFAQHADALEQSCQDLIGQPVNKVSTSSPDSTPSGGVITASVCEQVQKAMLAVEMRATPPCSYAPILDPEAPQSCTGTTAIFAEDWETGDDGWTRTSTPATPATTAAWNDGTRNLRDFTITSTLPAGHTGRAAYAQAPPIGEPGGGNCTTQDYSGQFSLDSPAITIPAGADDVKLSFDHYVATEAGVDGGQVEVSVNGGAFQLVSESDYVHNPPNSTYNLPPPAGNNTNPNPGEAAWHGTDGGTLVGSWGTTLINLSSLTNPGDTVKVRFTWSQDGCNGVDGWYIDNVSVYSCPVLEAPALSLGADYQEPDPDGAYTFNWTRPAGAAGPDVLQESSICAPLMSDDASTLAQWTVQRSDPLISPNWQTSAAKPQHTGNSAFWADTGSDQELQNSEASLVFNSPIQIPGNGITTLNFSEWFYNEEDDRGFVEVSTDGGATWTAVYTSIRPGAPQPFTPEEGADAFAFEQLRSRQIDLTIYSGQTIRLRFRFAMGNLNYFLHPAYGWYVDDISITSDAFRNVVTTSGTSHTVTGRTDGARCYRVRTTYNLGGQQVPSPYSNTVGANVSRTEPPARPDLKVANIEAGNNKAREGEKVTIAATISNAGAADAAPSKVEFLLDDSQVLGLADTPAIPAGGSAVVTVNWDTRNVKGEHRIKATADKSAAVAESDESNNAATLTLTIQGNKVKNGSFEQSNSTGSGPEGWSGSSTGAGTASWSDGGSDGTKSATATGNGRNALVYGSPSWTSDPIPVTAGQSLSLVVSVQSVGASSAAGAGLVYLGAAGEVLNSLTLITAPLTTAGFTRLEQAVTIPQGVAQVRIRLVGFAPTDTRTSGTITFDEVGLFENYGAAASFNPLGPDGFWMEGKPALAFETAALMIIGGREEDGSCACRERGLLSKALAS